MRVDNFQDGCVDPVQLAFVTSQRSSAVFAQALDPGAHRIQIIQWAEFAESIRLPSREAAFANRIALAAAAGADITALPVGGSPVRGAERELRHRAAELAG